MTNSARTLLDRIHDEYHNRLEQGKKPEQSLNFENQFFIDKYGYSESEFINLLNELSDYGYIKKWIVAAFELIID